MTVDLRPEEAFRRSMIDRNLGPAGMIAIVSDGQIHRYRVEGDKAGSRNGWYVLFADGVPAGKFGSWKTGETHTWCLKAHEELTEAEKLARAEQQKAAQQAREAEQHVWEETAAKVAAHWQNGREVSSDHSYVVAKGVTPKGARQLGEQLMIPFYDADGRLRTLQWIQPDGSKRYAGGGQKLGTYCAIGHVVDMVCVVEGWATGCSVEQATGFGVAIAGDTGNLLPAARALREKFPQARIVFCADNDRWTKTPIDNPGVTKAREAAAAVDGFVAVPEFDDLEGYPTDFNDLFRREGPERVQACILAALETETKSDTKLTREEFAARIDLADLNELLGTIPMELIQSGLPRAVQELLFKRIKKATGVSVTALRADAEAARGQEHPIFEDDDFVEELNRSHAVVSFQGMTRILCQSNDLEFHRPKLTFSNRNDFIMRYENRQVFRNGDSLTWGEAWLRHPDRREYRDIVFSPGLDPDPGVFNLWLGWGIEPKSGGSCGLYLEFVREVICGDDEEAYGYVVGWMAHLLQCPRDLPGAALVLRSGQRTGKGTFVEALAAVVGFAHYVELTNTKHLTGQFSGHLAQALLVFANEATWGGNKQDEGSLKAMVTDPFSLMEKKRQDAVMVRNYKRLIIATNGDFPIPRDADDARFVVLDVSEAHKEDWPYFKAIREQLAAGGLEELAWYLREAVDISDWHPRQIPLRLRLTGWDIKLRTMGSMAQWFYECLYYGRIHKNEALNGEKRDPWPQTEDSELTQEAYKTWCIQRRIQHIATIEQLGKELKKWGFKHRRSTAIPGTSERPWVYDLPPLDEARRIFGQHIGIPDSWWDDEDQSNSITSERPGSSS